MENNKKAYIALVASMVVFGTVGFFVRGVTLTTGEVLPSGELAFCRAAIALLLLGGYLLVTRQPISLRAIGKELPLVLLSGAAVGINWILLFEAYRYTAVSIATVSYYFAPTFVTVGSALLFRERMGWRRWICFLASTLGVALVLGADIGTERAVPTGVLFGLAAALFYAAVILLNKRIRRVDGIRRTFLQFVAALAVLLPYVLFTGGFHLAALTPRSWGALAVLGVVHTGIAYCFYFSSVARLSGQSVAVISYLDPVVAVLGSVLLLGETISPWQIVGSALILGFALLNEVAWPRRKNPKTQ